MQVFPFKEYGCFAMVYLWYVSKRGKLPDTASGIMVELLKMEYRAVLTESIPPIEDNCYVNNPDAIAKWFGIKVREPVRKEGPSYICEPGEEELLVFKYESYIHATAGDGRGRVTYDPLGYSNTVRLGRLESKRIITWTR